MLHRCTRDCSPKEVSSLSADPRFMALQDRITQDIRRVDALSLRMLLAEEARLRCLSVSLIGSLPAQARLPIAERHESRVAPLTTPCLPPQVKALVRAPGVQFETREVPRLLSLLGAVFFPDGEGRAGLALGVACVRPTREGDGAAAETAWLREVLVDKGLGRWLPSREGERPPAR